MDGYKCRIACVLGWQQQVEQCLGNVSFAWELQRGLPPLTGMLIQGTCCDLSSQPQLIIAAFSGPGVG
jgi:hypothetical protein